MQHRFCNRPIMVFEGPFARQAQTPRANLRAHHGSTVLTLGKWKKSGAINNSTRIIIKTTGILQSCQKREYKKKNALRTCYQAQAQNTAILLQNIFSNGNA